MSDQGRLAAALGGAAAQDGRARGATLLERALSGSRPSKPIRIPIAEIDAVMVIVGAGDGLELEAETRAAMTKRGIPDGVLTEGQWELDRAIRVLARAVVVSATDLSPVGSAATWGKLPPAVLADLWRSYSEFCDQFDPALATLGDDEVAGIRDAIEKKSPAALRSFGARRLSAYLLTSGDPPASSATSPSSPGTSSQPAQPPT